MLCTCNLQQELFTTVEFVSKKGEKKFKQIAGNITIWQIQNINYEYYLW